MRIPLFSGSGRGATGPGSALAAAGLAVALAVVVGSGPGVTEARAQQVPSPYEFIDHRHEGSVEIRYWNSDRGRYGIGPGPAMGTSARYGIHLGGPFSLEGRVGVIPTTRRVIEPSEQGLIQRGEADAFLVSGDARVRFTVTGDRTWRELGPYATMGIGLLNDFSGDQAADEELDPPNRFGFGPAFMAVSGVGTQWLPGDRLLFRVEAQLALWRLDTPAGFQDFEEELLEEFGPLQENQWVASPGLSLGVGLRF